MLLLLDNGSRRAGATLSLRTLARHLGERLLTTVQPVSALHSSRIPAQQLDGVPAWTLEPFLRAQVQAGVRSFGIVPLFFGPSRAIGELVPEVAGRVAGEHGAFEIRVAEPLCPLPAGEARLADILADHVHHALAAPPADSPPADVLLVDHGSPVPEVTAVRRWLGGMLAQRLGSRYSVSEAVMERREGAEYDFNGPLLATRLDELGRSAGGAPRDVVIAMQFLSPGRHAGDGGDIAEIVAEAQSRHPGLRVRVSRLIGEHPGLVAILADRAGALPARPPIALPPH